jgi:hypothetical protein
MLVPLMRRLTNPSSGLAELRTRREAKRVGEEEAFLRRLSTWIGELGS